MIKLKSILTEGMIEKATEDFLVQTIKGTEWQGKVFIAGGYVRDEFMGKDPKDLDILVNAPNGGIEFANWITKKIGKYKEGSNPITYPRFGTAKFNLRGITHNGQDLSNMDIEAVMPRKEAYTAGSRKPEVSQGDLADDVMRRDFTTNSLLKDLSTGEILDLTGKGKEDIKRGIVRTPLDPDKIFTDDPLRMLRAVRFAMKYKWDLPMFMLRGLKKNAPQLQNISQERIRDELDKMLMTGYPDRAVKLLRITGLLKYVIPELLPAVKMKQNRHHEEKVFDHIMSVLSKTKPNIINRLGALLHDIGKVKTREVIKGEVHFYDHENVGSEMAEEILKRLKYPRFIIEAVVKIIKNHMRLKQTGNHGEKIKDKTLKRFVIDMGDHLENMMDVIHSDNLSHASSSIMPHQIPDLLDRIEKLKSTIPKKQDKLPLTGNDLIKMGIKPGPIYKELLGVVGDKQLETPNSTKGEYIEVVKNYLKNKNV